MLETVKFIYEHWVLTTWFLVFVPFTRLMISHGIATIWRGVYVKNEELKLKGKMGELLGEKRRGL